MIEVCTNSAKHALRIARMEAIRHGFAAVETEHFVAGLLRADLSLALRLFESLVKVEAVRESLLGNPPRPAQHESVGAIKDLPLSPDCTRVVSYASAESQRLGGDSIAPVHLFLGVLREGKSKAASILLDNGVTIPQIEAELGTASRAREARGLPHMTRVRDLVAEVRVQKGRNLVGRARELEQLIQILCRRSRNSALLLGEPGVGKETLVHGLARRIAEYDAPDDLTERHVLMVEASELALALQRPAIVAAGEITLHQRLFEISQVGGPILYIKGLFDLRADLSPLASYLKTGRLQVIASGAPLAFRLALERNEELARSFEVITVLPPTDADAVEVIAAMKRELEEFHSVTISQEAIQTAVAASARFLRHRALPDRALDLLDDAATLVKLKCDTLPPELAAIQRRMRSLTRRQDSARKDLKLELLLQLFDQERLERQKFDDLKKELDAHPRSRTVTADDVLQAVANRNAISVEAAQETLNRPPLSAVESEVRAQLSAGIPPGRRDWVEGLMAYLADCTPQDAARLIEAIEAAKKKFDRSTSQSPKS
jgi:ATP-dependent Clp protease ATP-binding subunit ClpC